MCFQLIPMALQAIGLEAAATATASFLGTTLPAATAATAAVAAPAVPAALTAAQTASIGMQAAGLALSGIGAYTSVVSQQNAAKANAEIAGYRAADAADRGAKTEQAIRMKAAGLKGSQTATLASRGLDLGGGSALDILTGTDYMLESDVATAQDNTAKEIWGYKTQGAQYEAAASRSPFLEAGGTFLSGAGSVADSWYRYRLATA